MRPGSGKYAGSGEPGEGPGTGDPDALLRELREQLQGEVRWDALSRQLYSTDASIYQIEPLAVVAPRSRQDVVRAVRICRRHGASITARGAGTSLAGQAVGAGVQMDFSRHLDRILEIDPEGRWARVEPGVVLDNLNAALAAHGLQFGADVATSSRATVGGMIGNNSSGARSIVHGVTADHLLELDVVLADGSGCRFGPFADQVRKEKQERQDLEGQLYRAIPLLASRNAEQIRLRFPALKRRVSGYNLDALLDPAAPVDLTRLIAGSEGTLALVVEARLKLVPLPAARALLLVEFDDVFSAAAAVPLVLEHAPSAVELVDGLILEQTRKLAAHRAARALLKGAPDTLLLIELCADDRQQASAAAARLADALRASRAGTAWTVLGEPEQQASIWALRKAGVGLLMGVKGDAKPHAFVEDTAVNPALLEQYLRRFHGIVEAHGTRAGWYGHAGAGCLHVRPVIDLKSVSGRQALRSMLEQVSDLVLEFGGALSGEHGDGILRGGQLSKIFGEQLYQAFLQLKAEFDPDRVLNPGRIVDTPDLLSNLRSLASAAEIPEIDTRYDYSAEGGWYRAVEMCSGVGHCRKTLTGSMCPSYMATREEQHCTRGRANALRAAMEGRIEDGLTGEQVREAMDLCLSCKACKRECPSSVDMARFKSELLDRSRREHGLSARDWLVAHIDQLVRLGGIFAFLVNPLLRSAPGRRMGESLLGFDRRRQLPAFAGRSFRQRFTPGIERGEADGRLQVALIADCWTDRCEPGLGQAAVRLLEAAGFAVVLADTLCCGRPAISKGHLDRAVSLAEHNVAVLYGHLEAGRRVVGIEPSCLLTMRDDYPALLRGRLAEQARELARSSLLVEELLAELPDQTWESMRLVSSPAPALVQAHCHQQALAGNGALERVLGRVPDIRYKILDAGCCGMAGAFGYEVEHYELSHACAERALLPSIRSAHPSTVVLAPGFSCRRQIEHFSDRHPQHPIEFLAGLLP